MMSEFTETEMQVVKPGEKIPLPNHLKEFCSDDACPLDIPDDKVNHPSHYTSGGIECIDAIRESMTPEEFQGYCKGNTIKYLWRWRQKGGVEDLEKADVYLRWLIESATKEEIKNVH